MLDSFELSKSQPPSIHDLTLTEENYFGLNSASKLEEQTIIVVNESLRSEAMESAQLTLAAQCFLKPVVGGRLVSVARSTSDRRGHDGIEWETVSGHNFLNRGAQPTSQKPSLLRHGREGGHPRRGLIPSTLRLESQSRTRCPRCASTACLLSCCHDHIHPEC